MSAVLEQPTHMSGEVEDMDHHDYLGVKALSSTFAKKMLSHSPMHARFDAEADQVKTKAERRHFDIGTAIHLGVLEPDRFPDDIVICPEFNKRKKDEKAAYEAFLEEHEDDCVLTAAELVHAQRAVEAALRHPGVKKLLEPSHRVEHSIFWQDNEYRCHCKARFDVLRNDMFAVDVKSTVDASPEGFQRAIGKYGYYLQAGHYNNGALHVLNEHLRAWAFIAIEKQPPYGVACYVLGGPSMLRGAHLADRATQLYAECIESGYWPGYADTIELIDAPQYKLRERT